MPVPRSFLAASMSGHRLYVVGGCCDSTSFVGVTYAYDTSAKRWRTIAPLPTPGVDLAAARGRDGRIYVIGGIGGVGTDRLRTHAMESYDPSTSMWTCSRGDHGCPKRRRMLPRMPTSRYDVVATADRGGRIYVLGGYLAGPLDIVEAYVPARGGGMWICSRGDTGCPPSNRWLAPLPTVRDDFAAATGADGRIYALGGDSSWDQAGIPSRRVDAYDVKRNRWLELPPLPTPRYGLAAAPGTDGSVYVFGGCCDPAGHDLTTVEALVLRPHPHWVCSTNDHNCPPAARILTPMPWPAEHLAAATAPDDRIFLVGGDDRRQYLNRLGIYTPPRTLSTSDRTSGAP